MNNRTDNRTDTEILMTVVSQTWRLSRQGNDVAISVTEVIYHEH